MLPFVGPLIAAVTGGVSAIFDKIAVSRSHISWRIYLVVIFFLLFVFTIVLVPFLGWIKPEALETKYLLLFAAEIVASLGFNYYYYRSLQHESLNQVEVSAMTAPIARILLAAIVYPSERNIHVFIAAVIAAGALIFANIERRHLKFDKYSLGMILYILFVATEALVIKDLLFAYSPVALYAIRCLIIFLIFAAVFKPNIKVLNNQDWKYMSIIAVLAVPMMILSYYGFYQYGIIYTSLILLLSPLIILAGSRIVFRERMNKRLIIAAVVIVAAIVYVNLMR